MKPESFDKAITNLPDRYIEEALQTASGKKRHLYKGLGLAAAVVLCIGAGLFLPHFIGQRNAAPDSKNGLSVIVYAAEPGETTASAIPLEKGIEVQTMEYSPLMSCVPAMPFSFSYGDTKDVTFRITSGTNGYLLKFRPTPDDSLTVSDSGLTLECGTGENIYWQPQEFEPDKYVLTVEVLKDGRICDTETISIRRSDDNFCYIATLEDTK